MKLYEWLVNFYAVLATISFLSFPLFWFIVYFVYKDKKKATRVAMDITTFLLVGSVSVMYDHLFSPSFSGFWIIMLCFLIGAGLIGNKQNREYGQIDVKRIIKVIWRLGFLVLSFFYFVFLLVGLVKSIFFS